MCVYKNHAFIYFLRPPSWSGTVNNFQSLYEMKVKFLKIASAWLLSQGLSKIIISINSKLWHIPFNLLQEDNNSYNPSSLFHLTEHKLAHCSEFNLIVASNQRLEADPEVTIML